MRKGWIAAVLCLVLLFAGCGGGESTERQAENIISFPGGAEENDELRIIAFDVGKGDAFLLLSKDHATVIDTGYEETAPMLVQEFHEAGVEKIDELIITHFDKDHVGGAARLINEFEVGEVYVTYQSKESKYIDAYYAALEEKSLQETVVRDVLTYDTDACSVTIYPPEKESYEKKQSNNSSLVIRVSAFESSMLFTGDAEKLRIEELLETEGLESDILKMPHHGRLEKNTKELLEAIDPEYAIITSSDEESEDEEVMELLAEDKRKTFLTREGEIVIHLDSSGIRIEQLPEEALPNAA